MVANENKNAGTRGGTVNRCLSLAEAAATTFILGRRQRREK